MNRLQQVLSATSTDGVVTGYVRTANDIAARRRTEEELRTSMQQVEKAWSRAEQHAVAVAQARSPEGLMTVVDDILDYSKIEAGTATIESIDFDLRTVAEEVADIIATIAERKGLEVVCDLSLDLPAHVRGDRSRLRQLLTHLAGNALKFTRTGEVVIGGHVLAQDAHQVTVRLWVRDTGIGIPKDRQEAIFGSCTQADGSFTRRYGGTGLGLTITRQLVELMGGRMGVASDVGAGSTFWLEVKLEKQPVQPLDRRGTATLAGLRVLVVDDNASNRRILRERLRAWGSRADEASSGTEALALLGAAAASDPFGLVLLDMQMPGMDGEQTARAIKADPRLAAVALVLLSSPGLRDSETRAMGFAAVLTKPIHQASLLRALLHGAGTKDVCGADGARRASARPQLGLNLLLAEDNLTNQKVALLMLARCGCRADSVGNGREALEALARVPYDLVLMDVQMPEMDGLAAVAEIRARERGTGRRTPVIAMTANAMNEDRERCLAAGMDDYIAKPVKLVELVAMLSRWAAKKNPAAEASPLPRGVVGLD